MIGLIDCNNFFVSCERVFRPELAGKPVIVTTSHNDGCAVAISNEAKALGIKRGVPVFQIRDLIRRHNIVTIKGNHPRYGDLSTRVVSVIESVVPDIEVYSIDEAFIHFPGNDVNTTEKLAREIVRRVRRWVGIPTALGIAPTKTLAKIAAHFAKKYPGYQAVCIIDNDEKRRKALQLTAIGDVWGIGRRLAARLTKTGIMRAIDLADLTKNEVERLLNVAGQRTWRELNGEACIERDSDYAEHKQIGTSRTLTPSVTELSQLEEAVSSFVATASRRLRKQKSAACSLSVFLHTNPFRTDLPQYYNSASRTFEEPTGDLMTLTAHALDALRQIYRKGLLYRRAGVLFTDIMPVDQIQPSLFLPVDDRERRRKLNDLVDRMNADPLLYNKIAVASAPLTTAPHHDGSFSVKLNNKSTQNILYDKESDF